MTARDPIAVFQDHDDARLKAVHSHNAKVWSKCSRSVSLPKGRRSAHKHILFLFADRPSEKLQILGLFKGPT